MEQYEINAIVCACGHRHDAHKYNPETGSSPCGSCDCAHCQHDSITYACGHTRVYAGTFNPAHRARLETELCAGCISAPVVAPGRLAL